MKARITRGVEPLQIYGNRWCLRTARLLATALLLAWSLAGHAQEPETSAEEIPDDYYRAEFIILERIIDPESVNEKMSDRAVETTPETEELLWSVAQDGTTESTLELVPDNELHLNSAAQRLERSGRYHVLVSAGWYEAFPPDYEGKPLRVAIGDWLEGAGAREIEGTITIDRQRYLHVGVHLNHWQQSDDMPVSVPSEPATEQTAAEPTTDSSVENETADSDIGSLATGMDTAKAKPSVPLELLTWIRETRRMRSEEIHFLDSPTIGVLVFFKKIETTE